MVTEIARMVEVATEVEADQEVVEVAQEVGVAQEVEAAPEVEEAINDSYIPEILKINNYLAPGFPGTRKIYPILQMSKINDQYKIMLEATNSSIDWLFGMIIR